MAAEQPFLLYRLPSERHAVFNVLEPCKDGVDATYAVCPFNQQMPTFYRATASHVFDPKDADLRGLLQHCRYQEIKETNATSRTDYLALVERAISAIGAKEFQKVVLARTKFFPQPPPPPIDVFQMLCKDLKVFAYLLYTPEFGTWAGASPEVLFEKQDGQIRSMALAGTLTSSNVEWSGKESEEQGVVGRYIQEVFEQNGVSNVHQSNTFTVQTGGLQHIQSDVTGALHNESDCDKLIRELHPTPALGGYPKQSALNFIHQHEAFQRQLYGGFLGLWGPDHRLFVNIRCMQLGENGSVLYAGAGINALSNPSGEWEETEHKLSVMHGVLKGAKN